MSGTKRKYNELTIEKKKEIIEKLQKGRSQRSLASEYEVHHTTISYIKKNRDSILELWNQNCGADRKRKIRDSEHEEINRLTFNFFEACRSKGIPITGPMLQSKAKSIADAIGDENFTASNGWLQSFLNRHNISLKAISGESQDIDTNAVLSWKERLPNICAGYDERNIFNADETGLFFKQLPSRTLAAKHDMCAGGKLSKERLTVLLACNSIGEKLRPMVIEKAKCPRAFREARITPRDLPVMWRHNSKAFITSALFTEFINRLMKAGNRHILLFIDNAPSHPKLELSNIVIYFFRLI